MTKPNTFHLVHQGYEFLASEDCYIIPIEAYEKLQQEVKRKDEALIYAIKAFEENWELSETLKVMEAALMARADD